MRLTLRILLLLLGWAALPPARLACAQNVCASPGKDGATFSASPNTYYPGVGTAAANATTLRVGALRTGAGASTTTIGANDLLLVIQMQGADINNANSSNYGSATGTGNGNLTTNFTAGQYEYVIAAGGVSGGSIPLTTALRNTYATSAVSGTNTLRTFQVVRVPQYSSLPLVGNIVPAAWDGSTGGIVALDVAGAINLNGYAINASGRGFRGGAARLLGTSNSDDASYLTTSASGLNAQKGEGTAGTPQYVANGGALFDRGAEGYPSGSAARGGPGNAGGGGNDNLNNSGGAGGGNGGRGGRGGNSYGNNLTIGGEPGGAFVASGTRLVLGGGGGAGTNNNDSGGNAGFASSGSAGGGIVIVRAGSVAGAGSVVANAAATGTGVTNDGGGGGGAGGSILITAVVPGGLSGLTLSATGAAGGSTNPSAAARSQHGPGGGGGGGCIFTNGAVATATATGGSNGTTTYSTVDGDAGSAVATSAYNAAAGLTGQLSTSLSLASTGSTSGAACSSVINGTIFDDSNYGGGAGRAYGTANTSAVSSGAAAAIGSVGTTVELYDNAGAFVTTTTTTTGGAYTFTGLTAGASYTVRVVNGTVKSARTPGATGVVPVQTFRTTAYVGTGLGTAVADGNRVGGEAPEKQDAAARTGTQTLAQLTAGTATPQSLATVTPGTSGVDFGFNFDVVVNTNDAGQGSLRQFITNANALGGESQLAQAGSYTDAVNLATGSPAAGRAGVALPAGTESSIFLIPAGRLTTGVAVITPATALPQVTGANTALNGATQTFNIGNTNDRLLGAGGTVGTTNTPLSQLNGPEVQLTGSTAVLTGLNLAGANSQVIGLAIYGFGNNVDDNGNANITTSANNVTIMANALGSTATTFTLPAVANVSANVRVASGTGVSFTNNLVGFAGGTGIYLAPAITGASIRGNEIRGNGHIGLAFDGIDSHGRSTTATGNLFADGGAQGFDSFDSAGSNVVTGNTFTNNGTGNASTAPQETAAARFYGTGNTFGQNVSSGNYGAAVEVVSGTTLISRNAIFGNGTVASANGTPASGQVGIDLLANDNDENFGTAPYVTLNSDAAAGANNLRNYPILRTANIVGANLVLRGYAKTGAIIELFVAQPGPAAANPTGANFGQGRAFLLTLTEGATTGLTDTDKSTSQSYSGNLNGFNQGADTNADGFTLTIPLASLPGGTLAAGTLLTSTATLNGATSEFSGNVTAVSGPLPVVLAAFMAQAGPNREALLSWATASEVNSAYFDVERSLDGTTFTSIGRQAAQGTSTRRTSYAFIDAGIAARASGPVYYRLRQVDLDASASYSPVRTVAFGPAAPALSLYPNPAQQATGLDLQQLPSSATYQVVVLDATGRAVRQLSLGGGQRQPLDLAGLAPGSYYVLVTGAQADGAALRQTLHLTKE